MTCAENKRSNNRLTVYLMNILHVDPGKYKNKCPVSFSAARACELPSFIEDLLKAVSPGLRYNSKRFSLNRTNYSTFTGNTCDSVDKTERLDGDVTE